MKVLFISSWYPNSSNPLKGVFVKKHAAAIKKAGVEIEVLAITVNPRSGLFKKKFYREVDENGVVTHIIELNSFFYKFIHVDLIMQYSFLKKYYYRQIKPKFNPDIIHSNVIFPAGVLGYWLSKKEGIPHVMTEHWSKVDKFMSHSIYSGAAKKAYPSLKFVTVVSEFLKNSLSKHVSSDKIKVVPNVVNTDVFNYKEKNPDASEIKFSCVAHWTNPKRPDLIFKSLNEFSKNAGKKIILNVVGEGYLLEELKRTNWNFSINYLGNLPPQKLAELHQQSDYFLHASEIETFSIVIAEALATGTPVLASNVGAIPELVNDANGLLCENTSESWVSGLKKIISVEHNTLRISEQVKSYSREKVGDKFIELYRSIGLQ